MDESHKKTISNLFKFLKAFNREKTKPVLDIMSYEKTLWFDEIPQEKECYVIIRHISSENVKFNKWIEVKKPKREPYPDPPKAIQPWLKDGTLSKYKEEPRLFSYIIQETTNDSIEFNKYIEETEAEAGVEIKETETETEEAEEENKKVFLKDCPEVTKAFEDYITQKWLPWSEEEKRMETILKTYNSLYSIYKKNKNQSEVYQIVLGLGFLYSKNQKGRDIKRHIVTAPVSIHFNSVTGTIKVGPAEQDVELSLEMDMFRDSEKPKNCDDLSIQLSNLNNDFWKAEEFYNCLKSWLNSYDAEGQFRKKFNKPSSSESFTTLNISPAIILRKRNEKSFIKFYNSIIKDMENKTVLNSCFKDFLYSQNNSIDQQIHHSEQKATKNPLAEKHYFPLPTNEEQKKIIEKVSYHDQVVVQGPPGTGKTHSIANLICHFLAKGQKILVTSQTDRALRVLRDKLPQEVKPLCIEILGKDQKSFQELKDSFSCINSKYQEWSDNGTNNTQINQLEEEDSKCKTELAEIKTRLINLIQHETKKYENLFGFYTGTPAVIANRLSEEEPTHRWITEFFNLKGSDKCPLSNEESKELFTIIKKLKDIDDLVLKEPTEFLEKIFSVQQFEEKITKENGAIQTIQKHSSYENKDGIAHYSKLKDTELSQLHNIVSDLQAKVETLLNKNEQWIKQVLNNCLMDKDREWRYLYKFTNKTLDENKSVFESARTIKRITEVPNHLRDNNVLKIKDIENLLKDFFNKYKFNNQVPWAWYRRKPKTVRNLKKIKVDGKKISSFVEVKRFQNCVTAINALKDINNLWKSQSIDTKVQLTDNFIKNYHIFKDLCEPLKECLFTHKLTEDINLLLSPKNIPLPQWTKNSIKELMGLIEYIQANNTLKKVKIEFKKAVDFLKPYERQKNTFAKKIIALYEERDLKNYNNVLLQINNFKDKKKEFVNLCEINNKLNNPNFYKKLRMEIENPVWENRLMSFESAWAWRRADQWLKEQTSEEFANQLNQEKKNVLKQQQKNMERLVTEKAWNQCLSNLTNTELSSLKGWIQSINKIGKGTGKTAPKHRKVAKTRMEECKTAIPSWIMPLYRVVENINPSNEPFDVAIIDEASQTGPDGFLLNCLAKKIIVVGDKEQISPENIGITDEDVEIHKKKYLTGIKFFDYIGGEFSYYDYCETVFTGSHVQLREHFRCMPEIIQFSNTISYSGTPLIPLRQYGSSRLAPLKTTYVDSAVSRIGSGKDPQNEKEAKAIIAQIKQCIKDPNYDNKTFGIIVLQGKFQIQVIENALSEIDKEEIEKRAIHVGNAYDFQGDERDVIFLSMAVAKDWNMSALVKENHKKKYNVAASRAKDQMWLFHSIELNDLSSKDYRRKLLSHCMSDPEKMTVWPQEELQKLYKKIKETKNKNPKNAPELFGRSSESFDSWFEAKVFLKIALRGYHVIPQYAVSGYQIDMVIVGAKGRLAVECDGDYWHEGQEAKDMERQWQLERCGWTFWRLKESSFNRDEESALKSLWELLDKMQIQPLNANSLKQ